MGSLTHKAARTAAGIGIDQALKKVTRGDRETELLESTFHASVDGIIQDYIAFFEKHPTEQ